MRVVKLSENLNVNKMSPFSNLLLPLKCLGYSSFLGVSFLFACHYIIRAMHLTVDGLIFWIVIKM